MNRILSLVIVLGIILSSCHDFMGERISGNGNVVTENRSGGSFENVDVSGAISVYVKQDDNSSVKVEADDNLLEYIVVRESGNTLDIYTRSGVNLRPTRQIKVYVSNPSFRHFEVSGASKLYSENTIESGGTVTIGLSGASKADMDIKSPRVSADLSGASSVKIKGATKDFRVEGSGASNVYCFDLLTEETSLDISGAGHAEVHASVKLDVDVSGAASVRYRGDPTINQRSSGASSVRKAD